MNLKLTSEPLKHLGDKNKKKIYLGNGKFGPYLQIINENDKKKNPTATPLPKKSEKNKYYHVNTNLTKNIAIKAKNESVKHFIFINMLLVCVFTESST